MGSLYYYIIWKYSLYSMLYSLNIYIFLIYSRYLYNMLTKILSLISKYYKKYFLLYKIFFHFDINIYFSQNTIKYLIKEFPII